MNPVARIQGHQNLLESIAVDRLRNRYASLEQHKIMVHLRTLTIGVTVNLDNYENLRVEVTDQAGSPEEAVRVIRFLDEVLASLGRGDQATAQRIDHYRKRLFQTQSPTCVPDGSIVGGVTDSTSGPGPAITTPRVSAEIANLTGPSGSGIGKHLPDHTSSDVSGLTGIAETGDSGKKSGSALKGPGKRPPDGIASFEGQLSTGTPASALATRTQAGVKGIEHPAELPSRPRNAGSLHGANAEAGPGPGQLHANVPTAVEEKIPVTAIDLPVVHTKKETGIRDSSGPAIVCETCGGPVTPTEKKMSQLFASKTLCRRCMPRA